MMFMVTIVVKRRFLVQAEDVFDAETIAIKESGKDAIKITKAEDVTHKNYDDLVASATDVIPRSKT